MAITTRIAPMYGGQKIFAALLCAIFGVWGAYDYWVTIPNQERAVQRYEVAKERKDALESRFQELTKNGLPVPQAEAEEHGRVLQELTELSPGGAAPVRPSKFNRATQWVYTACLPFAPWIFWLYLKAKKQKYTLDDEDTLHFTGDKEHNDGAWRFDEIADIDMSRWMAKSMAYAVHRDGRRLTLDAYIHKNLHLIIGAIASRLHPNEWDHEAKIVKTGAEPEPDAEADAVADNAGF